MLVISAIWSQNTSLVARSWISRSSSSAAARCSRARLGACFHIVDRRTSCPSPREVAMRIFAYRHQRFDSGPRLPSAPCPSWCYGDILSNLASTSRAANHFAPCTPTSEGIASGFGAGRCTGASSRDNRPSDPLDAREDPQAQQAACDVVDEPPAGRRVVDPCLTYFASHRTDPSVAHRCRRNNAT